MQKKQQSNNEKMKAMWKEATKESNDWKVAATTLTCRHMATKLLCDLGPHGRSDATAHMELVVGVPDFWVLLDRLQQLRTIDERILLRHGHTARAPETEGRGDREPEPEETLELVVELVRVAIPLVNGTAVAEHNCVLWHQLSANNWK